MSVELRGTAFDFEHLFSMDILCTAIARCCCDNTSAYVRIVCSSACVRIVDYSASCEGERSWNALHVVFIRLREPGSWMQRLRKGVTKRCLALGMAALTHEYQL